MAGREVDHKDRSCRWRLVVRGDRAAVRPNHVAHDGKAQSGALEPLGRPRCLAFACESQPPFRFEGIGRSAFYAKVVLRLLYQAGLASA